MRNVAALIGALLVAALIVQYGVVRPLKIDALKKKAFIDTERAVSARGALTARYLARETLDRLSPFLDDFDCDAELFVLAAANAYIAGQTDRSAALYAAAVRHEGRPEILTYLGTVQTEMGRTDEAIESYGRAVAFAPSYVNREELGGMREAVAAKAAALRSGRAGRPRS